VINILKNIKENLHIYFPHQGTSLHNIYMVHFMPIVAIMGQCLIDLFYACPVPDINLKIQLWHAIKNVDETAVSVILARPSYLQPCFFCFFGHATNQEHRTNF
jgi:hypothetical protein